LARIDEAGQPVPVGSSALVGEAGIRSGSRVMLAADSAPVGDGQAPVAVLTVHSGPNAGATFDLPSGSTTVGRGPSCDVRLDDPMVSTHHARINVGDEVEIIDDNSSNGILVGGELVPRLTLRAGDRITLGETVISVASRRPAAIGTAPLNPAVPFNRSPRVDPVYEGETFVAPEPPSPQKPNRFPLAMVVMPLVMGAVLFAFIANSGGSASGPARYMTIVFVALSPLMMLGTYIENKRSAKKDFAEATDHFRANLADLVVDLRTAADEERRRRSIEHPGTADVVQAITSLNPLLWTRRPEHATFMEFRLGLGTQASRTKIELPGSRNSTPELQAELSGVVAEFAAVERVPVVGSFSRSGSFGVAGPDEAMLGVARGLVIQLVGLHSPSEVILAGMASARTAKRWEWLKWLPHVASDHSPLTCEHLASTAPGCMNLVGELSDLVGQRMADRKSESASADSPTLPLVVLIVEDDAPVARSQLVRLAEVGPSVGVHLIWLAGNAAGLPAACRSFIEVDPTTGVAGTGRVVEAEFSHPVLVEPVDAMSADTLARTLAPLVDAGAMVSNESDVPGRVSFLADSGEEVASQPSAVLDRWMESNSLLSQQPARRRRKRDNSLRALVGRTAVDPLHLDLRTQGPHALVGGTTGSGKSEFLQTWVLGMATAHSPQRVTFLFVDYKGGSAFADCVNLPHSVGLVTDLSPHLVQRALTSLNAELRYREHILNRKKAKDLLELERRGDPETPPSLVIVVDEFAALVQEVPEFVDGVVNVAQRGRSLGLHLILATQRPAGVIKDNLRANTNLRVALRMADEEDSKDVVGTAQAGTFDPDIPGRGIAKTGPGRLALFQSGYVGGWTSSKPVPPMIDVATLVFGTGQAWEAPEDPAADDGTDEDPGPPDIQRIVANVNAAAGQIGLPAPRKPWLPELADVYDLAALPLTRRDSELVIGVVDQPHEQQQGIASFRPDVDGNIAVFGTGGTGKSTFLRTLAIGAGLTARGGPCFVYGLDFGARGLTMLESLPHVGNIIGADDTERTARLIAQMRDTVDERAVRYAKVNAGTIDEYRRIAEQPDEPRVLLLIDGFAAFRSAYEIGPMTAVFDQLLTIAGDGRPVGVHVAISADRLGAVPAALSGSMQRKLALRLSNEMDEAMLNVPRDGFGDSPPPGRGFVDGTEVQVAVFGGSSDVAAQAAAINRLAESMRRAGAAVAPAVQRLPERVALQDLSASIDGRPVFGMADDTLGPIGFEPSGMFLVAGPSGSGRSTTVRALVEGLRRSRPGVRFAYFGQRRSPLSSMQWDRAAVGASDSATLAEELTSSWENGAGDAGEFVVLIDGIGEFLNSDADYPLQDLLKVCRANGTLVIADGETSDVQGSWPLLQTIKAPRHGIVLQPDQTDGDALFRTQFPRMSRADFPVGRGMYVRGGRATRVQVGAP
jgi:S-DNA-T family DNA segregation ATPase FtsK/SpoIIIE